MSSLNLLREVGKCQPYILNAQRYSCAEAEHWHCFRQHSKHRGSIQHCTPQLLALKALGLSLSDQYWLRPAGAEITWQEVNFFTNDFSQDIGSILFSRKGTGRRVNFLSPDSTTSQNNSNCRPLRQLLFSCPFCSYQKIIAAVRLPFSRSRSYPWNRRRSAPTAANNRDHRQRCKRRIYRWQNRAGI